MTIELLNRTLYELVSNLDGYILDIDHNLLEILPHPAGIHLEDIFCNFKFDKENKSNQITEIQSKYGKIIRSKLIFRGAIEDDSVFRK